MKANKAIIVLFILLLFCTSSNNAAASTDIDNDRVVYHWILARWDNSEQLCRIDINHEGLPTGQDIISQCGQEIFDLFFLTPSCDFVESGTTENCEGLFLKQIESKQILEEQLRF